ncbi:MAG: class I SAM-dependent methyltransferase [Anaerolineae bacterium]|nr:class I SAM-dependent methyltransferase [Anaerolineae bacterium]
MIEIRHVGQDRTLQAYNTLYSERSLQHLDGYYQWLIRLLKPRPGSRLLDISCGEGALVYWAKKLGLNAWGVDFAPVAVRKAYDQVAAARLVVADGQRIPLAAASFENITSIGSLEHYEDPEQGMREIARLLTPSGKACVLLPNAFGLLWNIKWVWKTGDVNDDGQPLQRYATINEWQRMLTRNGLRVLKIVPHQRALPGSLQDWLWYVKQPHKLLTAWLGKWIIPRSLASTLVYICEAAS